MYTLLLGGIIADQGEMVRELGQWIFVALFVFFMLLTAITLMNMLVDIIYIYIYYIPT